MEHRSRTDIALCEAVRLHTSADGDIDEVEEYGLTINLNIDGGTTAANIDCNVAPPTVDGQRIRVNVRNWAASRTAKLTFANPVDGTNNTVGFNAGGEWAIFEAFDSNGTLIWEIVANRGAALPAP